MISPIRKAWLEYQQRENEKKWASYCGNDPLLCEQECEKAWKTFEDLIAAAGKA